MGGNSWQVQPYRAGLGRVVRRKLGLITHPAQLLLKSVAETKTINTQPHLGVSKAGCPVMVRLNLLGESRQEAQGRKSLQQLKTKVRIGCWDIRTLYHSKKLAQLAQTEHHWSLRKQMESHWEG